MTVLGYILIGLGCIAGLVGNLRFLVLTYRHGPGWFFTCLFLPLVGWIFFLLHAKEAWRPVALPLAGVFIAGIGYQIGRFDFL
jgi:FtsH-binding integral membrane protein